MKGGLSAFPFIAAVSGLVLLAPCARPQSSDFHDCRSARHSILFGKSSQIYLPHRRNGSSTMPQRLNIQDGTRAWEILSKMATNTSE